MEAKMRAYMSNPDSGTRRVKRGIYESDRAFCAAESVHEARRILAETEAPGVSYAVLPITAIAGTAVTGSRGWICGRALADALARFCAE
jgi:hypothetical protein